MAKFKYQDRSVAAIQKRIEQRATQFDSPFADGVKLYKAVDGENCIRILPATWDTAEHYGLDVYMHYKIGESQQTYVCPLKMNRGPCPVCNEAKAFKPKNKEDETLLSQMKPGKRVLVWVIDRNNEDQGPLLYPMPWTMDKDISAMSIDSRTGEILRVDHHEEGFDVFFNKSGTGLTTKYTGTRIDRRETPLHTDPRVVSEWLNFITELPLPQTFKVYPFETIDAAFSGKTPATGTMTTTANPRRKTMIEETDAEHEANSKVLAARMTTIPEEEEVEGVETEVEEDAGEAPVVTARTKLTTGLTKMRSSGKL